jgi:hypothetical protein
MMTLTDKIIALIEQAKAGVARVANSAMVCTYYLIGKLIVKEYQMGEVRAGYGVGLLQNVSAELTQKLGKGYSVQNLEWVQVGDKIEIFGDNKEKNDLREIMNEIDQIINSSALYSDNHWQDKEIPFAYNEYPKLYKKIKELETLCINSIQKELNLNENK